MKSVFTDVSKMNDYINFKSQKEINVLMDKYPKRSFSLFMKVALNTLGESLEVLFLLIIIFGATAVSCIFFPLNEIKIPLGFCAIVALICFIIICIELSTMDYNSFIKDMVIKKMSEEILTIQDLKDIKYYLSKEILDFFMKDMAAGRNIYWGVLLSFHEDEMKDFTKKDRLKSIQEEIY